MPKLRNLSIRHKQMFIIMLTSAATLLLACAGFVTYDVLSFRQELTEQVTSLAQVVGNNCTAALDFNDPKSARETLGGLRAEPTIASACVYNRHGDILATYNRQDDDTAPVAQLIQDHGYEFRDGQLHLYQPITADGEEMGTIYLAADLDELNRRLARYGGIVAMLFAVSLLVAYGISSRLHRMVTNPVLHLAQVARSVAENEDYSLRAVKQSSDELGNLTDDFNKMLAEVQKGNAALQKARDTLEHRVSERTDELAGSLALLNATLEATADGILALDMSGKHLCSNNQFATMWGISKEMLDNSPTETVQSFAAAQLKHPEQFERRRGHFKLSPQVEAFDVFELKDGRVFERYSKPQLIAGKCVGVVINWRDVTEQKRAGAALAETSRLLEILLENSPDKIYFKDLESRFVRCSKSVADAVGISDPACLEGKTDFDFFSEDHAQPAYQDEQAIIRTGASIVDKQEKETHADGRITWVLTTKMPWRDNQGKIIGTLGTSKDITAIKEAEYKMDQMHRQLLDASRQAGMAEVASSVLHNVGNVLNSVNTSASVISDQIKKSKVSGVARITNLLEEHRGNLAALFSQDGREKQIIDYLRSLSTHLTAEQEKLIFELQDLTKNIDHIKDIVAMQQNYAKVSGVTETLNVIDLVEDSLRMNSGALVRHQVRLVREFAPVPAITVERHKVLQILVNLIRNAKYACDESDRDDKQMTLQVANGGETIKISVIDNGVGIPPENLTRIFSHGFTTRKEGHGFGLHSAALAAREMGGNLHVHSNGSGTGATFTLELPLQPKEQNL